jgi:hypothetical protein
MDSLPRIKGPMQCTASAAIMRMASLTSCPVPVPANSVGESSPCCHDFSFRHYSHQTAFFCLHTESPSERLQHNLAINTPSGKFC